MVIYIVDPINFNALRLFLEYFMQQKAARGVSVSQLVVMMDALTAVIKEHSDLNRASPQHNTVSVLCQTRASTCILTHTVTHWVA